jgi:heat shock protein HtpX
LSTIRPAYVRDRGLTRRLFLTGGLLALLYIAFASVLFTFLESYVLMVAIAGGLAFAQYFFSDKLALKASGAKVVSEQEAPELHAMVERLCATAELPKPKVAVIDTDIPNAFATGRSPKNAAVAVTSGLWRSLEPREVEGVVAHELAHIKNRDVLIMTLASFFAMIAGILTRYAIFFGGGRDRSGPPVWLIIFVVSVVTYFLSYILIRTISRYREYAADRGASVITGAPENLISALRKISSGIARIPQRDLREVESMNAFFIVPTKWRSSFGELFLTHPPLEKRLAALEQVARDLGRPV